MKSLERELQEALEQERDLKEKISDLKKKLSRIEMQDLRESDNQESEKLDVIEGFQRMGLTEEEAKVAAAGRPLAVPVMGH
jgi:hypothetical protein